MSFSDVAAKAVQGFAGAAGNPTAQAQVADWQNQRHSQQQDALKMQLAPLTQAISADRQKLTAFIDDKGNVIPEHQKDYDATVKNMTDMLGRMRGLMGNKAPDQDPNHFESTVANLTDKLHITRDLAHRLTRRQQEKSQQYQNQTKQMGKDTAAGVLPYAMTPEGQGEAAKTQDAIAVSDARARNTPTYENFRGPNGETVTIDTKTQTPPPGYVKAGTTTPSMANKELKPLEAGGVPYGVFDPSSGKQYLPSQLGANGDAPPEAKQIWKSIQDAKAQKEADERRKEDETADRQAKTIAAGFERMGQSQQFQELMAQYRSDLTSYRTQNTLADNSEATVNALKAQYAQPGNKSVADNELQNFYTTVVQKGGRKTAAELNLTLKVGSFGLNLQQIASKAATGELPDKLRKMLLDGMEAVAKEQRAEADKIKPELPKLNVPEGPKTKQLKGGGKSLADRLNEAYGK